VDQIEEFYLRNLEVEELFSFDLPVNVDDQLKVIINLDMHLYLLRLKFYPRKEQMIFHEKKQMFKSSTYSFGNFINFMIKKITITIEMFIF
jgi:hypothetical protein